MLYLYLIRVIANRMYGWGMDGYIYINLDMYNAQIAGPWLWIDDYV